MKKLFHAFLLITGLLLLNSPVLTWGQESSPLTRDPMRLLAPHKKYKIEWWYVTGFLKAASGERMGFQGTFFRFATSYVHPPGLPDSPWEPREIVSFHGAISFLGKKIFVSKEATRREFRSIAGTREDPFMVNVEENRLEAKQGSHSKDPVFSLTERVKGHLLTLSLRPETPLLWQDPTGRLKTGPGKNDWAWYYSYPDLAVSGTWTRERKSGETVDTPVTGQAWFDHEWTDSALGGDQIGWIWMWGRFKAPDGIKGFMMFQMIRKDGTLDSYKGGTLFQMTDHALKEEYVRGNGLRIDSLHFKEHEGSCLPKEIVFHLDKFGTVRTTPYFIGQEINGNTDYWEGGAKMPLESGKTIIDGRGYLEVTGVINTKTLCK